MLERDEDVLDTWLSSAIFFFFLFYPTSILENGLDIIYFWDARMVMMGLELTDQLLFHTVYLHVMMCDKEDRKMFKNLSSEDSNNACSL